MTKKERLEAIIAHYSDGKNGVFAAYIGVAASTISTWLARDTYDPELLFAKCEGISASWLLSGEGNMLCEIPTRDDNETIAALKETIAAQKITIEALTDQIKVLKGDIATPHCFAETA